MHSCKTFNKQPNGFRIKNIVELYESLNIIEFIIVLFVETPRKFITAKLSIRKPGSSSVLLYLYY